MGSETTLLPHLDNTGLALNADARFRHVFSEGFDPILLTDHTGKILDGNRQALAFFGIDRKALLEDNTRDLHPPDEPLPDVSKLTGPGASSFQSRVIAARVRVPASRTSRRPSAHSEKWMCASHRPGRTSLPARSMRCVASPARASTSASLPTAMMRCLRTASACAQGCAGFSV